MDGFNKHLLSTYSVPSTLLGTGDMEMQVPCISTSEELTAYQGEAPHY